MRTKLHDPRLFWREENRFIQANVRGGDGRLERRSTKCVDEQAAVLWVNEQERIAANPRYRAAAKATLFPAIEAAQRELQRRKRSAGTLSKFTQKAGHLLRLWGSDMTLARISAATVEDYIAAREREGVKPITVHAELQALRLILKVAAHHGLFEAKLEQVMPILYSSQHKPRTRWLSLDEMRALFDHVDEHHAAHLGFMAATGARRGESQRAERQDVDWDRGVVRIRGTKTEGAAAEIPITAITAELLAWSLACAPNKEGVLFRPWHNLNRDVAAACVRAGIARCSPNDLRRTFAQWHRTKGIGAGDLAIMLRHTTSKLAETTYAKLSGENLGKLLEAKLGPVLNQYETGATSATADTDDSLKTAVKSAPGLIRTGGLSFRKASVSTAKNGFLEAPPEVSPASLRRNCGAIDDSSAFRARGIAALAVVASTRWLS